MTSTESAKGASKQTGVRTIGRRKTHKFPVERAEELIASSRSERLDTHSLFALLPMRVYHHMADIGCGPGYFTISLAKYAFHGKIYAVDMQQGMLDITSKRLQELRLNNVEMVLSKETKIPLDDESVDGALIVNTLHESTNPKAFLKETFRLLRKGGWAGVVDWRKTEMEEGPPVEERLDREQVSSVAQDAGFRITSRRDINEWFYFILLLK